MTTHVKVLGVLFLIIGGLTAISAVLGSLALGGLASLVGASREEGAAVGAAVLGLTGVALAVVFLAAALLCGLCGWGLLGRRRWARILGIVLAAIGLVQAFPLGTIFGVYALWVLFTKETETLLIR